MHPAPGSHSALEVAGVRIKEWVPGLAERMVPLLRRCSASPRWSIGMRVYFCTMGGGGGHCTLLSPFRGPVDVAIFGTITVIPVAELCPQ